MEKERISADKRRRVVEEEKHDVQSKGRTSESSEKQKVEYKEEMIEWMPESMVSEEEEEVLNKKRRSRRQS